jgi:hypothetical protein
VVDKELFYKILSLANRHVAEVAAMIKQQEQLITELRDRGHDTKLAESLLEKLRKTARTMAEYQESIAEQIHFLESDQG